MAFNDFRTSEMASFSRQWTVTDRDLVLRVPGGDELVEDFETFLEQPVVIQAPTEEGEGPALDADLSTLDTKGDTFIRGTMKYLTGMAELSHSEETRSKILGLRDRLLPDGVELVKHSWMAHGATAEGVHDRLTDADRALLPQLHLLDVEHFGIEVDAWSQGGSALRAGTVRRAELRAQEAGQPSLSGVEQAQRRKWMETTRHLQDAVTRTRRLTPEEKDRLLSKLAEADRLASERRARQRARAAEASTEG